ncbi:hypothetical protein ccbrp13_71880 [Ktedonobacteria bacterium brp13]|nr:hypothetical protein ccbrp13_71880 [Ktedonobacteria bacterium brp13]
MDEIGQRKVEHSSDVTYNQNRMSAFEKSLYPAPLSDGPLYRGTKSRGDSLSSNSSNNSIKPYDSISFQETRYTSSDTGSGTSSEQEGTIYMQEERSPLADSTKRLIKKHLDAIREEAQSNFSVGYDFENVKPVKDVIDKIYKPVDIDVTPRYEAPLHSSDLSFSSGQSGEHDSSEKHSLSHRGSEIPDPTNVEQWAKFHKKKQKQVQEWQRRGQPAEEPWRLA